MLEQSLPIYCNGICARFGVRFLMQGSQAFTDYSKIVIPVLDIKNRLSITLGMGYTVHEVGHISHTDPNAKLVFFEENGNVLQPLALTFYRAIEDVRMERKQWETLAGAKRILNNLVKSLVELGMFQPITDQDNLAVTLQKMVLYFSRGYCGQQKDLLNLLASGQNLIDEKIFKGVQIRAKSILSKIPSLKDTKGSVDLALELVAAINEEIDKTKEETPNCDESPQPSSSEEGASSNSSANLSGFEDKNAEKANELEKALAGISESDMISSDLGDIVSVLLEDKSAEQRSKFIPISKVLSTVSNPSSSLTAEANSLSNVLRTRLLNYLEELSDKRYVNVEDGDELDDLRASEVLLGETEVWLERETSEYTLDTAVHLLLDRSPSMSNMIHEAAVASLGIGLALNQVDGVEFTSTAFPSGRHDVLMLCDGADIRSQSSRFNVGVGGDSTPMASAMWQSVQTLCQSELTRKILIVVTDGQPNGGQYEHTEELIRECELSGIETIGIGIGPGTNVERLFPTSVTVDSINQLSRTLFATLQKTLQ